MDEESDANCSKDAVVYALHAEVHQLKKRVKELVYMNNRYHLAISNCTFCASDEPGSPVASTFLDASIRASTPVGDASPSSGQDPALLFSPIPALMSLKTEDRRQVQANTVAKRKDETFINRMVKTLAKLEVKYQIPEHKRKKRLFTRKQKTSPIVPREFASIYRDIAAPEPEAVTVTVPEPYPRVWWSDVRFKPALPNPQHCVVHSCSQNPEFYKDEEDLPCLFKRWTSGPFGTLPGYKTSLGVVAVPTTPVGGYVYCPDAKEWVLYAEPSSSPSAGRGTRRGGTPLTRRRKG